MDHHSLWARSLGSVTSNGNRSTSQYAFAFTSGTSALSAKTALPNGGGLDADRYPTPLVAIVNASIVVNITTLDGLENATFTYGNYGSGDTVATELRQLRAGTLLTVEGQRLAFTVSREGDAMNNDGTITVEAQLIGDFCKRAPTETLCVGHNAQATAPPPTVSGSDAQAAGSSAGSSPTSNGTVEPPASPTPTPPLTKSATAGSVRRCAMLSALAAWLLIAAV